MTGNHEEREVFFHQDTKKVLERVFILCLLFDVPITKIIFGQCMHTDLKDQ